MAQFKINLSMNDYYELHELHSIEKIQENMENLINFLDSLEFLTEIINREEVICLDYLKNNVGKLDIFRRIADDILNQVE
jgi:hypothetical protein